MSNLEAFVVVIVDMIVIVTIVVIMQLIVVACRQSKDKFVFARRGAF